MLLSLPQLACWGPAHMAQKLIEQGCASVLCFQGLRLQAYQLGCSWDLNYRLTCVCCPVQCGVAAVVCSPCVSPTLQEELRAVGVPLAHCPQQGCEP